VLFHLFISCYCKEVDEIGSALDPHPDPNEEHYPNMIYVGRMCHMNSTRRLGFDVENGVKFIFGTSFDESHKEIEEKDLLHHENLHDLADRGHKRKTREEILKSRRHKEINPKGPKPFGHVEIHPLDGGVMPPKVVEVFPFFMDATLVTNQEFSKFVRSTYYETEAQQFGWSFVLDSFLPNQTDLENLDADPEAEHWVAVDGAYWRQPEGPGSTYKHREKHPVVHVSHKDAAEYCEWAGKRLPGEREWEAAARAGHYGPKNRTLFLWGDEDSVEVGKKYINAWGLGKFPYENFAEDGWRGTSPSKFYPPNKFGFYDLSGNVWEWMRGGKHKQRILRGASYVDSFDGSFNHAATLGARATLHATTTTGNIGFRCVKSPKRRTEYHYVYHDEEKHGELAVEDQYGKQYASRQKGWEDKFHYDQDDEEDDDVPQYHAKKKRVVREHTVYSNEL